MNIAKALAELDIVISLTNILNIIKVIQERKEVEIEIQKIIKISKGKNTAISYSLAILLVMIQILIVDSYSDVSFDGVVEFNH